MKRERNSKLHEACHNAVLARFCTSYDSGSTCGYVLDIGPRFFLLALIGEDLKFNGFQCQQLSDVRHLRVPGPYSDFIVAALRKRSQLIHKKPNINLSDLPHLLISVDRLFPLVTIHRESVKPNSCWIGRVVAVTKKHVLLHEIGPDAIWDKKPTKHRLSEITRVDFGGGYEEALDLVGGNPKRLKPTTGQHLK